MDEKSTALVLAMKNEFKRMLPAIQDALPKTARRYLTPERLVKVALMAYRKQPRLWECTQESIMQGVMEMAQIGLEIGSPFGHAYLVPYKNHGVMEAQAQIGYRGFVTLARRSGEIESVKAEVVCAHDLFKVNLIGREPPTLSPPENGEARGTVLGAVCVAYYMGGGLHQEYMTTPDIKLIQARSKMGNAGAWKSDWNEMAKKTVVRRAAKYWPLCSEEMDKALEHDNRTAGLVDVQLAPPLEATLDKGVDAVLEALSGGDATPPAAPETQPPPEDQGPADAPPNGSGSPQTNGDPGDAMTAKKELLGYGVMLEIPEDVVYKVLDDHGITHRSVIGGGPYMRAKTELEQMDRNKP